MGSEIALTQSDYFSPATSFGEISSPRIELGTPNDYRLSDRLIDGVFRIAETFSSSSRSTKRELKIKRRLHGFFIQQEGEEARVAFVDNGRLVHYYFPYGEFRDAGVTVENQPFELDEYSIMIDGVVLNGHAIRAAAKASDSYPAPIDLDEERKKKLAYILSRQWDADS